MWAGLVSSTASPWLADGCFLTVSSYDHPPVSGFMCTLISSSCKDTRHVKPGPKHMTLFFLIYLVKDPVLTKILSFSQTLLF